MRHEEKPSSRAYARWDEKANLLAQSHDCAASQTCSRHTGRRLAMAKSIKAGTMKVITVMVAIGLDLADEWSDWVGLDEQGEQVRRERVKTTEAELLRVFGGIAPTKIAIEVGTH